MDQSLLCNNLHCRKELTERALVTTCSHIFCLACAHHFGFAEANGAILPGTGRRSACPACRSDLPNQDDAVIAHLNPTEDYKTSVLSGLSPNIIMECSGRALSFWAYQATQEMYYQRYVSQNMVEKYSLLATQLERRTSEANSEIESLQSKLQTSLSECEILRRKNEDLALMYREKNRKLMQAQEAHDKERRKAELGHIQQAASEAVDYSLLNTGHTAHQILDGAFQNRDSGMAQKPGVFTSGQAYEPITSMNSSIQRPQAAEYGRWPRTSLQQPQGNAISGAPIPSSMRQRLGNPSMTSVPSPRAHTQSFSYGRATIPGLGLIPGLKVSDPTTATNLNAQEQTL